VRPGMVVVDVGANVGLYTLHAARLVGSGGKVHSFEPTPETFQVLKDNVQVNGFLEGGTVALHQAAVTDRTGAAELRIFRDNCGQNTLFFEPQGAERVEVSTVSLDEALAAEPRVDVIKIDAEGAEPLVLRGMRGILHKNAGIRILIEFAPVHLRRAGVAPRDFLDEIEALGLDVRRIEDETGELLEVSAGKLADAFSVNLELSLRANAAAGGGGDAS
jgi:FkbM family methyltransferase